MESPTIHANSLRYNLVPVPSNLKRTYHHCLRSTLCVSVFVCLCFFLTLSLSLFRFVVQECTFQFKQMELLTTTDASFEEKTLSSQYGGVDESTDQSRCVGE